MGAGGADVEADEAANVCVNVVWRLCMYIYAYNVSLCMHVRASLLKAVPSGQAQE